MSAGDPDLVQAVIARRSRRAPRTAEERAVHEQRSSFPWFPEEHRRAKAMQERCGWANHEVRHRTASQALSLAAAERALEEAGVEGRAIELMNLGIDAVFDGYELGCVLTSAGGDGTGRALKTAASASAFVARAARASMALDAGPLADVVRSLAKGWLKGFPKEAREIAPLALRRAVGAGLVLHHFETGLSHPSLATLHDAKSKQRSAPVAEARHAAPNEALIEAILAAPDDDDPRLVYADWLTEQGDPRGELIHIQLALGHTLRRAGAQSSTRIASPALERLSVDELKDREKRLIRKYERVWTAETPSLRQWFWRRGFVFAGIADAKAFAVALPTLRRTPLERVQLTGLGSTDVEAILGSVTHPTLRWIDFSANRLTAKTAVVLGAPLFAHVRALDLGRNDLGRSDTARAVAVGLGALRHLTELDLGGTALRDDGLAPLADGPTFERLEHLGLGSTELTPAGIASLSRASSLTSLCLSLPWNAEDRDRDRLYEALLKHAPPTLRVLIGFREKTPPTLTLELRGRFTIDDSIRPPMLYR